MFNSEKKIISDVFFSISKKNLIFDDFNLFAPSDSKIPHTFLLCFLESARRVLSIGPKKSKI